MHPNRIPALVLAILSAALLSACGGSGGSGSAPTVGAAPLPPSLAPDQPVFDGVTHDVTTGADAGMGSLRECLAVCAPGDRIQFDPSIANTTILLSSPLVIDCDVHIEGPATGTLALSGDGSTRVIEVRPGVSAVLSDLTIGHGSAANGAGVYVDGSELFLERVVLDDNDVSGPTGRGGGLQTENSAVVVMTDCTVQNCSAFNGGGVAHDGGLLIARRCVFLDNRTTGNSGAGVVTQAETWFENCNFAGNVAPGGAGGALFVSGGDDDQNGEATLIHCTLDDNEAADGGAIANLEGVLRLYAVAIGVHTTLDPTIDADILYRAGTLDIQHTYMANGTNSPIVDGVDGNRAGTLAGPLDLGIIALVQGGGSIQSFVLTPTSILRDAISALDSVDIDGQPLLEDSIGTVRPMGTASDVGATEAVIRLAGDR